MSMDTQPDVVGVDGGGTTCRVALILGGQRYQAQVGAANASTDFDGAIAAVREGLSQAATAAGRAPSDIHALPAYVGLAGVVSAQIAGRVAHALTLKNARIGDDRETALVGALGGRDGAVVSVGTGSFLGLQAAGETRLIGGHGLTLGDEASGAWLGRALLGRVLQCVDGIEPHSALTREILATFNGEAAQIVAFASRATPREFGEFAPRIVRALQHKDPAANALMRAGASYIARGLAALGWRPDMPLVLLGGVGQSYLPVLKPEISGAAIPAQGSALDGALRLATALAGGQA